MRVDAGRGARHRPAVAILLAAIAVCALAAVPVGGTAPEAAQGANDTFVVRQGDACYDVTPLGDGSRSVESFYDYRSHATEPTGKYSAYGADGLQLSDTSQLFLYRGSGGLSLVFLHDEFGDGARTGGGTITADVSGLPAGSEWVVEDDTYPERDDVFRHEGSRSHVEWVWAGNRTDGGAVRGFDDGDWNVTVRMRFNEASARYPFEEWHGQPADNRVESWVVRSAGGELHELDTAEAVTVARGPCDATQPEAALSVSPNRTTVGETVRLDASASSDDEGVTAYRWDLDGDGTVDRTTGEPTVTATFDEPGRYAVSVTVVDGSNNTDAASDTVVVDRDGGTTEPDRGISDLFGPGFGVAAALVALTAVALFARRRGE